MPDFSQDYQGNGFNLGGGYGYLDPYMALLTQLLNTKQQDVNTGALQGSVRQTVDPNRDYYGEILGNWRNWKAQHPGEGTLPGQPNTPTRETFIRIGQQSSGLPAEVLGAQYDQFVVNGNAPRGVSEDEFKSLWNRNLTSAMANAVPSLQKQQLDASSSQFDRTFGEGQRQFNQRFGEDQRQFDETIAQNRRSLLANLRGPDNAFQYLRATEDPREMAAYQQSVAATGGPSLIGMLTNEGQQPGRSRTHEPYSLGPGQQPQYTTMPGGELRADMQGPSQPQQPYGLNNANPGQLQLYGGMGGQPQFSQPTNGGNAAYNLAVQSWQQQRGNGQTGHLVGAPVSRMPQQQPMNAYEQARQFVDPTKTYRVDQLNAWSPTRKSMTNSALGQLGFESDDFWNRQQKAAPQGQAATRSYWR